MEALGDYIGGKFLAPEGQALESVNPAREGQVVFKTAWSPAHIDLACEAASAASSAWARLSRRDRYQHLLRFRDALSAPARKTELADAIVLETGKLRSEAIQEIDSLIARFDLIHKIVSEDLREGPVPGRPGETLRYHPLGVVAVIGPFNFPLHLCHAYALPALLAGNTVVIKPSEIAPLAAQRYAQAAAEAKLPEGVVNVVLGTGTAGARLVANPAVRGLFFTGSYPTGRKILETCLDRPELLVALEMGGKNTCVVCEDAEIRQAAHEIVVGGYLSSGQRCTATDRVLVHRSLKKALVDALRPLVGSLRFGDPDAADSFAGPISTAAGRTRFEEIIAAGRAGGAEAILPGGRQAGGFFMKPSIHLVPDGRHDIAGYTDTELFGPDVHVESFGSDDEAIAVLNNTGYGFANSIFTDSDQRFEHYYRETLSGIINRNRSTNQASPALPFGGVKKSGNFRPGGAHVGRSCAAAVAVQENVIGRVTVHPFLLDHLPPPGLDQLEERHITEEAEEAKRSLIETPRPMAMMLPRGGVLPRSEHWLTRLYAGDRVVREKKPAVFDHLRSAGPWFVSVDDEPLSVLDGMSQTATLCGGFAEPAVVRGYIEGAFGPHLTESIDTSAVECDAVRDYEAVLRHLVPGLPHVTFVNSGAEAAEKALALCRLHAKNPAARRVLAFEGGFHGRTLLAIHATHSPSKRQPFEMKGYEATFAAFPVWNEPSAEEPLAPSGFYAMAGSGDLDTMVKRFGADGDPLLAAEVASLAAVHRALDGGDYFACIIEPMQSEGGDRYATARFFKALRLLTRYHEVSLIFDEVQTGFALGGPFAWHSRFRLVNFRGQPDYPDAVTFAKRAQVGVCMSAFADPEPSSAHGASLIRGRIHADMVSTAHSADRIEKQVSARLQAIKAAFPHLVQNPRCKGYAFGFDLPSPAHLAAYLEQRFWRGAIVFGAGTQTVRYRLSEGFLARDIDLLFDAVRRSLAWLDAHPGAQPPAWEDFSAPQKPHVKAPDIRLRLASPSEAGTLLPTMLDIEYRVYEPARRTPPADIRAALEDPEGATVVAEVQIDGRWELIGFAIGQPLEGVAKEEGPDQDPMLGKNNTLYSVSITLAPEYQGFGIGEKLKHQQLNEAAARKRPDGSPRYRFVTSRNRIGHTPAMRHLNDRFGAHVVFVLYGQYEDPEGQAVYYRIPLSPIAPVPPAAATPTEAIDCRQGLARPFARPPESLRQAERSGLLYGPAVNKLTIMNYATPGLVRSLEWVSALAPRLPHMYLANSRDESVDKALRIVRFHKKEAKVAIGVDGGYVGHTTALARSISDPAVHRQGPPHFDWPRIPHPADVGSKASLDALKKAVAAAGGIDAVLGLYIEPVQERTGKVVPNEFWEALAAARKELDVPVICVESASACYRSGVGAFATTPLAFKPDILVWWGGGQNGYIHVDARWRIAAPLAMVSTWDGDELSLVREHHQLRAARKLDLAPAVHKFDEAAGLLGKKGLALRGQGLYRVLDAGDKADAVQAALGKRNLLVRPFPQGRLALVPGLDEGLKAADALLLACREINL